MIGLSLTASYALRILAHLARSPDTWVRGAGSIASTTSVPRAYTVKLLQELGRIGLVRTKVGCHGGYRIAEDPETTTALDVVMAVDGPELLKRCLLGRGRCSAERGCPLHATWSEERKRIEQCLNRLTLGALASHEHSFTGAKSPQGENHDIT